MDSVIPNRIIVGDYGTTVISDPDRPDTYRPQTFEDQHVEQAQLLTACGWSANDLSMAQLIGFPAGQGRMTTRALLRSPKRTVWYRRDLVAEWQGRVLTLAAALHGRP